MKAKGVDLTKLDFVVMSHRHTDHMSGLNYLLTINPKVKIYAPKENFGVFGFSLPGSFYRQDESLPAEIRYYDGEPPQTMRFGTPGRGAVSTWSKRRPRCARVHLISLGATGTQELRELSLAVDTPDGVVLVVGCAHPGIQKIVEAATTRAETSACT